MKKFSWLIVLLLIAALMLAACGGAEETTDTTDTTDTAETTEEEAAETEAEEEADEAEEAEMEESSDEEAMEAPSGISNGLDKDLSGVTIRMANIGGQPYEAMYDSIGAFEEATGATVEIVFLGDGFEIDRYLKTNYAAGTEDFDVAWNHTRFMAQYANFIEPLQD